MGRILILSPVIPNPPVIPRPQRHERDNGGSSLTVYDLAQGVRKAEA